MNYRKLIKEEQEKFLNNPRQSIENLIKVLDDWIKGLSNLSAVQNRPLMLKLFYDFYKEYSILIGKLYKPRIICPADFKKDDETISLMMRIREIEAGVRDYQERTKPIDVSALVLSRLYATSLEIFWNKIRKLVILAGLNNKKEHLGLDKLNKKVTQLEKSYDITLSNIKLYLDPKLRNSVNHENTRFENPNIIVFLDKKGNEINRLNSEEICEKIVELMVINMAIENVEKTLLITSLKPLLKLTDEQLKEFCKTGRLTKEMEERITK